jgi:protein-S-isoprenylcysteine O-methyltransferase Ste14
MNNGILNVKKVTSMKKFGMAFGVCLSMTPTLLFTNEVIHNRFIIVLLATMFCWVVTEAHIGFTKSFEGVAPKQPIIKISRILWLLSAVYAWIDFRYNWSTTEIAPLFSTLLLLLCCAGVSIRIWAVAHLGKSFTYDVITPASGKFITTGPYRFIRHPAYLGILIISSFPGLVLGSIPGFIGMLLTTIVPVFIRATMEDALLAKEFGETYLHYKRSTYSVIPFIY